jgi:hypothetical protein
MLLRPPRRSPFFYLGALDLFPRHESPCNWVETKRWSEWFFRALVGALRSVISRGCVRGTTELGE